MTALLILVTVRQFAALKDNSRLLTQNRILTGRLEHQAFHDELTGLPSRAAFNRTAERVINGQGNPDAESVVLLIDLDGFKAVNDTLGHQTGDQLLIDIAGRLTREAGSALVCRLGGHEFVVLAELALPEAADLADRLIGAVAAPAIIAEHLVQVSASIGISGVTSAPTSPAHLLRRADDAMYAAKRAGRIPGGRTRCCPTIDDTNLFRLISCENYGLQRVPTAATHSSPQHLAAAGSAAP